MKKEEKSKIIEIEVLSKVTNIDTLSSVVELDEFDDKIQNKRRYDHDFFLDSPVLGNFFERNVKLGKILDVGCGSGDSFLINSNIKYGIEPSNKRYESALKNAPKDCIINQAFAEDTKFDTEFFDTVFCWGTFCFVRSINECLLEFNRILKKGGILLVDVVESTNLPIAQTVNPIHFTNYYLPLFGFEILEKRNFEEPTNHKRMAICARKVKDFKIKDLLVPQMINGDLINFDMDKFWFMK